MAFTKKRKVHVYVIAKFVNYSHALKFVRNQAVIVINSNNFCKRHQQKPNLSPVHKPTNYSTKMRRGGLIRWPYIGRLRCRYGSFHNVSRAL